MPNAFDDIPDVPVMPPPAPASAKANAFDDITPPPRKADAQKAVTAGDRVQATEGGFLKGTAYLATSIPDAAVNVFNLGRAGLGTAYRATTGNDIPSWLQVNQDVSPVGGWLTRQMDKSPITTTQPTRPDDTASRYLSTAGSVVPGMLSGGGGIASTARGVATAIPPALAGQYVAESKPFESDWANNAASIAAQAAGSLAMPRPAGPDVPGNEVRNQTIRGAQEAGMVFPPATVNPTPTNRLVENIAGKQQVQQHATLVNRDAVNQGARADLGLPGKGGISEVELGDVRDRAAPAYEAVRKLGTVATGSDPSFVKNVQDALTKYTGAGRVLSNAGDSGIRADVADILSKPHADAGDLVDTISVLRDRSKTAFRNGDAGIGAAYRQVSDALEDQIEKGISGKNIAIPSLADKVSAALNPSAPTSPKSALENFRDARRMLAVAHSVEDARNEGTGDINAQKLSGMLSRGVPLQGNLLTAARAASAAPKAFAPVTDSRGVNHLGLWGAVLGGAALGHEISPDWGLAPAAVAGGLHGARLGARMYALGSPGQNSTVPQTRGPIDPRLAIAGYLSQMGKSP